MLWFVSLLSGAQKGGDRSIVACSHPVWGPRFSWFSPQWSPTPVRRGYSAASLPQVRVTCAMARCGGVRSSPCVRQPALPANPCVYLDSGKYFLLLTSWISSPHSQFRQENSFFPGKRILSSKMAFCVFPVLRVYNILYSLIPSALWIPVPLSVCIT